MVPPISWRSFPEQSILISFREATDTELLRSTRPDVEAVWNETK